MLAEITVIVQDGLPEVLVALSVFLDELARGALGISDAVVGTVSVGPVQVVLLLEVGVGVEADIIAVQHLRRESLQAGGQGAEIVGQGSLALELLLVVLLVTGNVGCHFGDGILVEVHAHIAQEGSLRVGIGGIHGTLAPPVADQPVGLGLRLVLLVHHAGDAGVEL